MNVRLPWILIALLAGCSQQSSIEKVSPSLRLEVHVVSPNQGPNTRAIKESSSQRTLNLQYPPVFTQSDIAKLEVTRLPKLGSETKSQFVVEVDPTQNGLRKLNAAAKLNGGQTFAFVLNGGLHGLHFFKPPVEGKFNLVGNPSVVLFESVLPRVIDGPMETRRSILVPFISAVMIFIVSGWLVWMVFHAGRRRGLPSQPWSDSVAS